MYQIINVHRIIANIIQIHVGMWSCYNTWSNMTIVKQVLEFI